MSDAAYVEMPLSEVGRNKEELDQDALHILPLEILPVETPGLKRARLIKNVRLDSVVELFREADTGSGQVHPSKLAPVFTRPMRACSPVPWEPRRSPKAWSCSDRGNPEFQGGGGRRGSDLAGST